MPNKDEKYDLLIKYIKGELSEDQCREFEKILKADPELKDTAGFLANLTEEDRRIEWDTLKTPALSTFDRLLKDFKISRKKNEKNRGVMVFDSKLMPPPEGVRPATVDTRRIKYRVGEDLLEISLYPVSPESYELIGQLSGQEAKAVLEIEFKNPKTSKIIKSNEFQLFRVDRLATGQYKMKIKKGKQIIAQIDIEL